MISLTVALLLIALAGLIAAGIGYWVAARSSAAHARQLGEQSASDREHLLQRVEALRADLEAGRQRIDQQSAEISRKEERLAQVATDTAAPPSRNAETAQNHDAPNPEHAARKALLDSMQRLSVEYTTQATSAVVNLPSEDLKGRIIGREGRNIRAFEQVTGTDLIIDESPEAVVISTFDPVRKEVARLTLMNLMLDGRIHPARIEELHAKAQEEVELAIKEAGEDAAQRAGVPALPFSVTSVLGKLKFRFSYAQNVLDHSVEVAQLSQLLAQELGLNVEVAKRAGLLHDIGKALGPEWEGSHALAGMEFLKSHGEPDSVTHAVGAHHREIEPTTGEAQIVLIADAVSAARPGARREALDQFVKRLTKLEEVANSFPGVERSYAIQAGRELRVIVKPGEVDDAGAASLAESVAKKIELTLQYPGQIKVTVIRETRAEGLAK